MKTLMTTPAKLPEDLGNRRKCLQPLKKLHKGVTLKQADTHSACRKQRKSLKGITLARTTQVPRETSPGPAGRHR